jgi:hypothetical protein
VRVVDSGFDSQLEKGLGLGQHDLLCGSVVRISFSEKINVTKVSIQS